MGPAPKPPVPVHLSVHHEFIDGRGVAVVAVDRGHTQPHRRARGQRHAADFDELGGDPGRHRRRRFQPDDLFDEDPDLAGIVTKQVAKLRPARQFEQAESDRRRHRVQSRQDQQVAHAEQFQVTEVAVAGHDPRQHVGPRALSPLLDHVDQVREQVPALLEVGRREVGLVADDGVLPPDQAVPILQRQTVEVHEHLKRVEPGEIRHHFAFALGGKRTDHLGGVPFQHRPRRTESVRAEERLQYLSVPGVLRGVKSQRQHGQWVAGRLKDRRREDLGVAQCGQYVLAARDVVVAVHEHHRPGVAQRLPPDAPIHGHGQLLVIEPREVERAVLALARSGHPPSLRLSACLSGGTPISHPPQRDTNRSAGRTPGSGPTAAPHLLLRRTDRLIYDSIRQVRSC